MERDDLVQAAERGLRDAEAAYRLDPSDANRRRVMQAWSEVQAARGESTEGAPSGYPLPTSRP